MAKTVNEAMTAIADSIRANAEDVVGVHISGKLSLSDMPNAINETCRGQYNMGVIKTRDEDNAKVHRLAERLVDGDYIEIVSIDSIVDTAINDFDNIKEVMENQIDIPSGTPTSEYGYLVNQACEKAANDASVESYNMGVNAGQAEVYEEVIEPLDEAVSKTLEYANLGGSDAGASLREKITFIKNNISNVYSTGEWNGRGMGESIGRESEKTFFWNTFQNEGSKNSYRMAFFNWKSDIYNPIYPVTTTTQNSQAYYYYQGTDTKVPIIVSGGMSQFFTSSKLVSIPLLDVDEITDLCDTNNRANYHPFGSCSSLKNITFSGVIGKDMWISDPPLTKDSILGIKVTYSEIEVGKILQTDYSNFGFRVDSHTTNDSGDVTSIVATPVQSEEQYATYPILRLDEVSVTFNLVKIGENYYWGGIFGALKDYSGSGITHTLTIGTTNLGKLTDSEKAIAIEKGWTLA